LKKSSQRTPLRCVVDKATAPSPPSSHAHSVATSASLEKLQPLQLPSAGVFETAGWGAAHTCPAVRSNTCFRKPQCVFRCCVIYIPRRGHFQCCCGRLHTRTSQPHNALQLLHDCSHSIALATAACKSLLNRSGKQGLLEVFEYAFDSASVTKRCSHSVGAGCVPLPHAHALNIMCAARSPAHTTLLPNR
jgi:hypothetical protein